MRNGYICKKIKYMSDYLRLILEQATSQNYKSNAIKPLMGGVIICFVLSIAAYYFKAFIIAYALLAFGGLFVAGWLFAYFFCLVKDPNLLRSEKYNLERTAMEKVAVIGDSHSNSARIIPPSTDYVIIEGRQSQEIEQTNE